MINIALMLSYGQRKKQGSAAPVKKNKSTPQSTLERRAWARFIAPAMIFLVLFSVVPMLYSFGISLTNYNLYFSQNDAKFVGLRNYIKILKDGSFLQAAGWTFAFSTISVLLDLFFGMLLAMFLTTKTLENKIGALKTVMVIPMMIAPTVIGTIWGLMFSPNYGVINNILIALGHSPVNWTTTEGPAKLAIILVEMWSSIPFCLLIFMGALKTVPAELYEAAMLDGANRLVSFFKITLPSIRNFVAMVVTVRVMDSLRAFDVIYTLTSGGPGTSTETIGMNIYKTAITYSKLGLGSAGAFLFLIVIAVISFVLMRVLERKDGNE